VKTLFKIFEFNAALSLLTLEAAGICFIRRMDFIHKIFTWTGMIVGCFLILLINFTVCEQYFKKDFLKKIQDKEALSFISGFRGKIVFAILCIVLIIDTYFLAKLHSSPITNFGVLFSKKGGYDGDNL
jgi:hypothetical protein